MPDSFCSSVLGSSSGVPWSDGEGDGSSIAVSESVSLTSREIFLPPISLTSKDFRGGCFVEDCLEDLPIRDSPPCSDCRLADLLDRLLVDPVCLEGRFLTVDSFSATSLDWSCCLS